MGASELGGAGIGLVLSVAASPYLARITLTAPDDANPQWWRGATPSAPRFVSTGVTAAALGALAGAAGAMSALLPAYVALALTCIPLVVIDYELHRLPLRLTDVAAGVALVLLALAAGIRHDWADYLRAVEAGAVVYIVFRLLAVASPTSFGRGDVRLGAVLALYLGFHGWSTVYYGIFAGFLLGSLLAIALLVLRRATMKTALAFGPMLIVGALIVLALHPTTALVQ